MGRAIDWVCMFVKCIFFCHLEQRKHEAPLVRTTGGSVEQLEYFALRFLYPRKPVATFQQSCNQQDVSGDHWETRINLSKRRNSQHACQRRPSRSEHDSQPRPHVVAREIFVIRLIQKLLELFLTRGIGPSFAHARTHIGFDVEDINQRLIIPFDFIHQPWGYY